MATTTERLELLITAKVKDAVDGLRQAEGSVGGVAGKMDALDAKMAPLNSKLQSLGLSGVSSGAMVAAGAGVAVAGLAGLAMWAQQGIDKQLELADSVRGIMDVSGLSADQASRLVEVTGDYGLKVETVERAFWKLSSTVDDNRGKIEQHGIKIRENKDGTVDLMGTVENIQEAYKNAGSQVEKNAILFDAFGKSGKDLIPVLEETGSLARALADVPESRILSEEDIQQARDYQLAMDDLHDALDALQREAASAVIPTLTTLATTLSGALEGLNGFTGPLGGIGGVVGTFAKDISPLALIFHGTGAASELMAGHFRNAAEEGVRSAGAIGGVAAEIGESIGIFDGGSDAADGYTGAQQRVAEASQRVIDLSTEGKDKSGELKDAQKELSDAKAELENKTQKVANALQDENDKTRESIMLADQKVGGLLGVFGADLQYQQALRDHAAKQEELSRLEREGKEDTLEYAGAKLALEDADLKLVQSGLSLEGQIRALKDQVDSGKLSNEEYQARIDELRAKYPQLGEALDRITWKVGEHHGAIDAVPTDKHTNFTVDVEDAIWNVGRLKSTIDGVKNVFGSISGAVNPEGRASGGPVSAGWTGWVGEQGPELVSFSRPAHVFSHRDSMAMVGGASTGASNSYAISVSVAPGGNPAEVGRAVVESIKQYERRAGTSWRN